MLVSLERSSMLNDSQQTHYKDPLQPHNCSLHHPEIHFSHPPSKKTTGLFSNCIPWSSVAAYRTACPARPTGNVYVRLGEATGRIKLVLLRSLSQDGSLGGMAANASMLLSRSPQAAECQAQYFCLVAMKVKVTTGSVCMQNSKGSSSCCVSRGFKRPGIVDEINKWQTKSIQFLCFLFYPCGNVYLK